MRPTSITATTPAVGMMRASARRLNSRPSENISRMTPSSARVRIVSSWAKNGMGVCGPDDDAGQQVAQDHRQAQLLAGDRGERRRAQHQGQVLQEG